MDINPKYKFKMLRIRYIGVLQLIFILIMLSLLNSCKKDGFNTIDKMDLTITKVSNIGQTSATVEGFMKCNYVTILNRRGFCWSTKENPTISDNYESNGREFGLYSIDITGLTPNTIYYIKGFAEESGKIMYGDNTYSFRTEDYGTFEDIEGNVYRTVIIGTQVWMADNLKTTKYRNGDPIANVTDNTAWSNLTSGAYCWYDNDSDYKRIYGALYNFYSVADTRKIAPLGWHIPNEGEWLTLASYVRGSDYRNIAGGFLKETGTTHWESPNSEATNTFGFNGLPGGYRSPYDGFFNNLGNEGFFWSSRFDGSWGYCFRLTYDNSSFGDCSKDFKYACSIRCVKD